MFCNMFCHLKDYTIHNAANEMRRKGEESKDSYLRIRNLATLLWIVCRLLFHSEDVDDNGNENDDDVACQQ